MSRLFCITMQDERRDDVERADDDDERHGDRDAHLLEPQRREERLVHRRPVARDVAGAERAPRSAWRWRAPRRGRATRIWIRSGSARRHAGARRSRATPGRTPSRTRAARASRCRRRAPDARAREHAERRQRPLRRQKRSPCRPPTRRAGPARSCPSRMPGRSSVPSSSVRGIRSSMLPFRIAPLDVGDVDFERRVDALDRDEGVGAVGRRRAPCRGSPGRRRPRPESSAAVATSALVVRRNPPAFVQVDVRDRAEQLRRAARPGGRSSAPAR